MSDDPTAGGTPLGDDPEEIWIHGETNAEGHLLFTFDTDNDQFARGWEAGKLYFQVAVRPTPFVAQIHPSNIANAKTMCKALNRQLVTRSLTDQIVELEVGPLPERPAPMPAPMPERQPPVLPPQPPSDPPPSAA